MNEPCAKKQRADRSPEKLTGAAIGMRALAVFLWCVAVSGSAFPAQAVDGASSTEADSRYQVLKDRIDVEMGTVDEAGFEFDVRKGDLARANFFELFDSEDYGTELEGLGLEELRQRYRAAEQTAFWAQSAKALEWLERAFMKRYSRNDMSEREIEFMYGLHIWNRRFEDASSFQEQYGLGGTSVLPEIRRAEATDEAEGIAVWRVDGDEGALVLDQYHPGKELIVMTMDVRCSASRQALEEIMEDKELKLKFEQYGLLLHGPSTIMDFDRIAQWNKEFPQLEIVLVNRIEDWPQNRGWSTPRFHFFREGELVSYERGWKSGKLESVRRAANELLTNSR
ncbi:MAG: hypothetical protein GVY11_04880 [Gammaproteobacteria bacterium]|jgi:hypothetical protein|nr:hypothetical protein [Gammaproteobacteria bacterium]